MKKSILAIILIAVMIVTMLSGCAQKGRVVRVNTSYGAYDCFTSVIIQEQGLLEKHLPDGVTIEWSGMVSGNEKRDALVAGQLDIGGLSVMNIPTSLQNDFPLVYVTYIGSNRMQLYSSDPNIKSLEDLTSDLKISVSSIGTGPHTAFLVAATNDLGSAEKFENSMITMTNSDALNALMSGTEGVDAAVSTFPTLMTAWEADNLYMVRDLSDGILEYGIGVAICTTEEFAKENPDILDAYLAAYEDAVKLLEEDRETCVTIMMEAYEGCSEEQANYMLEFFLESQNYSGEKYDKLMDFMYEHGLLEQKAAAFADIPKYTGDSK